MPEPANPSDFIAERIQQLRRKRGWSAAQLAQRCAEIGAPELTAWVIGDVERGRREKETGRRRRYVTVDEMLAFAYALEVAPVHLLVPPHPSPLWAESGNAARSQDDPNQPNDTDMQYPVTAEHTASLYKVRQFIRGIRPLPGIEARSYFSEVPPQEYPTGDDMARLLAAIGEEPGRKESRDE